MPQAQVCTGTGNCFLSTSLRIQRLHFLAVTLQCFVSVMQFWKVFVCILRSVQFCAQEHRALLAQGPQSSGISPALLHFPKPLGKAELVVSQNLWLSWTHGN